MRDAKNGRAFVLTDYKKHEKFCIRTVIQGKVYRIKYLFFQKKRFVLAYFHEWSLYPDHSESQNVMSDRFNWHVTFEKDAKTYFFTIEKNF